MPMQLARCPECGAPVGGQSHQAVEGVTRATTRSEGIRCQQVEYEVAAMLWEVVCDRTTVKE